MIVEAVLLSLVVAFLRKGKISRFGTVDIKGIYLFMMSAFLQLFLFRVADEQGSGIALWFYQEFYLLHLVTYILLLITIGLNLRYVGLRLMGIGTILNLIPIAFNQGKMPVKVPAHIEHPTFDLGHMMMEASTSMKWLSDIIYIREPYPIPKVVSIGDIFIMAGVFWLIQTIMCQPKEDY